MEKNKNKIVSKLSCGIKKKAKYIQEVWTKLSDNLKKNIHVYSLLFLGSIKKTVKYIQKVWIKLSGSLKKNVNVYSLLFLVGIATVLSGLFMLVYDDDKSPVEYLLIQVNSFFPSIFKKASTYTTAAVPMISWGMILICTAVFNIMLQRLNFYYVIWTMLVILPLISFFLISKKINVIILFLVMLWIVLTVFWMIKKIYIWTVSDSKKTLAKLTFLWGIIAALMSIFLKG